MCRCSSQHTPVATHGHTPSRLLIVVEIIDLNWIPLNTAPDVSRATRPCASAPPRSILFRLINCISNRKRELIVTAPRTTYGLRYGQRYGQRTDARVCAGSAARIGGRGVFIFFAYLGYVCQRWRIYIFAGECTCPCTNY
jgi:hypothetical protein